MVYYFCHCMSLYVHVCPGDFFFISESRLFNFLGKKLSFWLSACSVSIVMSLL